MKAVESATRILFATLSRAGSEAAEQSSRTLSSLAWSDSQLSLTRRELKGAVDNVLSSASLLPNLTRSELKNVLSNGSIRYINKPAELSAFGHVRTGYIKTWSGEEVPVVERVLSPLKAQTELKAARIGELMPFDNYTPVTVLREPGLIIQQRMGLSLEDFARKTELRLFGVASEWEYSLTPKSFSNYLKSSTPFRLQMEQAQVQRSILGDFDSTPANFAVALKNNKKLVGNIDMNQAFELIAEPAKPNIFGIQGMNLSSRTIASIEKFAQFQNSSTGRELLRMTGATADELHFMNLRTNWFLKHKKL